MYIKDIIEDIVLKSNISKRCSCDKMARVKEILNWPFMILKNLVDFCVTKTPHPPFRHFLSHSLFFSSASPPPCLCGGTDVRVFIYKLVGYGETSRPPLLTFSIALFSPRPSFSEWVFLNALLRNTYFPKK